VCHILRYDPSKPQKDWGGGRQENKSLGCDSKPVYKIGMLIIKLQAQITGCSFFPL
jgi:hypothetical protein